MCLATVIQPVIFRAQTRTFISADIGILCYSPVPLKRGFRHSAFRHHHHKADPELTEALSLWMLHFTDEVTGQLRERSDLTTGRPLPLHGLLFAPFLGWPPGPPLLSQSPGELT